MARIELRKVNKIYPSRHGPVHAVRDLDLSIDDGEFLALLGPSGCGKSSTLRMIVGLETVTSGEILFDGRCVNDLEPRQRNVAMAFETYALYPNFTVQENLAFPLEVRGEPPEVRKKKAGEIAELLRLTSILDQYPATLSGGEQQRVSLGRALIREPAAFILDEVMSHLDAHLKFQMLFDLKAIHREMGKTTVYVTHDQIEAMALADRVAVMDHALLQQVGDRHQLYRTPANMFVADFIGEPTTNFFPATVDTSGDELRLRDSQEGTLVFRIPRGCQQRVRELGRTELTVGLRPQHLRLSEHAGEHTLAATVRVNEYLGEQSILTLYTGNTVFRALASPDNGTRRDQQVSLAYDPDTVMVFDNETKQLVN